MWLEPRHSSLVILELVRGNNYQTYKFHIYRYFLNPLLNFSIYVYLRSGLLERPTFGMKSTKLERIYADTSKTLQINQVAYLKWFSTQWLELFQSCLSCVKSTYNSSHWFRRSRSRKPSHTTTNDENLVSMLQSFHSLWNFTVISINTNLSRWYLSCCCNLTSEKSTKVICSQDDWFISSNVCHRT